MWRRIVAALIDLIVVFGGMYAVLEVWGEPTPDGKVLRGLPALLLMLSVASYFVFLEWAWGATLGKWLTDIKVVSLGGRPCGLFQAVKRNLLRLVDFACFYAVAFVAARLTKNRQRLGDQWAGTVVVEVLEERAPQETQSPPAGIT